LEDKDKNLRFWCLKILSSFKPKQYTKQIASFTDDESADVRAASCECLGEIGDSGAEGAVKKCLKDGVWFVKLNAIKALEKIIGERCLTDIVGFIKDDNWFIRESVKKIMIKHIEAALIFIEQFLNEGEKNVKTDCLEVLDVSGYTAKILEEIDSRDEKVKNRAIKLLRLMIKVGSHFGFNYTLSKYPDNIREKILGIIMGKE